jgi:hypothetical protein
VTQELRALLFGDVPIDAWPPPAGGADADESVSAASGADADADADVDAGADADAAVFGDPHAGEPGAGVPDRPAGAWAAFVRAREHLAAGDVDLAIREWSLVADPIASHESRHVLQAWTFLRSQDSQPDASIAGEVLGVVAEVALDGAHDVLAAYRDGSIRFLHHLGGATIVEPGAATPEMALAADRWLAEGQRVHDAIGPWDGGALPVLPAGSSRFTMLTRDGPSFGQGPDDVLHGDPLAGGLLAAAATLLQAVVAG